MSYFSMNIRRGSPINRILLKNKKKIKTGASFIYIYLTLIFAMEKSYSMTILEKMPKETAKIVHNKIFKDKDCSVRI